MSRYLLLFLLNAPLVLAGLFNTIVAYKMSRISRAKFAFQVVFWLVILAGLAGAYPIYQFLFSNKLTDTEPLSLFDVIQITGIIAIFFVVFRLRSKVEVLEKRTQDLHRELSIQLSDIKEKIK